MKRVKRSLELLPVPEQNITQQLTGITISLRLAQMTGHQASVFNLAQGRLLPAAAINCKRTAGMEMTARWWVQRRRDLAADRFKTTAPQIDPGYFSQ